MIDYDSLPKRTFLTVDMRSFYASASAVMLGLDPMKCYLAVVGDTERSGSVVLAASPALKKRFGIKTGSRLYEIPDHPQIHIVNPQMRMFIKLSTNITHLFYQFASPEDILTYSVDSRGLHPRDNRVILCRAPRGSFFNVVFYSSTKAPISSTNENWIKWDIFKIYIYVTVILTFKKGLILMKKADK
uniref:Uvr repair protein n=1 Tax=Bacillus subtilis subsp. natto TaxID=86029 RepID=E9RJ83_BACNA|nr:uvr repair protein [Bacillus subtilis subsp. natto]